MNQPAAYVPAFGDWDMPVAEVTPSDRMLRTKSRAYQCCVWQGYVGLHNLFLGRYVRAVIQILIAAGFVAQVVGAIFAFSWRQVVGAVILLIINVAWWKIDTLRLARTPEGDPVFAGLTPKGYLFFFHKAGALSPIWGKNYWGIPAEERFTRDYPHGIQPTPADATPGGANIWN